jgi:TolB-like protein/Flp pilus assembly protein TadD
MADRTESESPSGPAEATAGAARHLFISYASQDAGVAQNACSALEAAGFLCWMAPRDVKPGAQYADSIVRAINEAKALVVVLSASAVASSHVGREVERAASKHKQIIAFRLDAAPLSPALEYFLGESQWIDVSVLGMSAAMTKLAEGVDQGPATSAHEAPVTHRDGGTQRRVAIIAAMLLCVGAAAALGVYFWSMDHRAAQPTAGATITDRSIAVLPFADMSEEKDQEYFADGMAEEVLDLLAKIPDLKVIGRTSSFQFKGKSDDLRTIGDKLGAAYIVEGSVRKAGPRIRVTAQLIDARSGTHRWSESYDRDFGDVLALQDDIATGVARALQLAVSADVARPSPLLQSNEAYTLYLRGQTLLDQQAGVPLLEAINDFEQALALDPSLRRAAEALALAHVDQGFDESTVSGHVAWQQAREAAKKLLLVDPNSATAHGVLGLVHAADEFDWTAAEAEFMKAFALNPRDPVTLNYAALVANARGQRDEALRRSDASLALDPLNPYAQQWRGSMLFVAGDFTGAEVALRKSLAIGGTFDGSHMLLGRILVERGKYEAALEQMQAEVATDARDMGLAIVYNALGRKPESDAALTGLIQVAGNLWPVSAAVVHAYRGEREEVFKWLEKAYELRDSDLLVFVAAGDPAYAPVRDDPRYKAFLRKMNLPE